MLPPIDYPVLTESLLKELNKQFIKDEVFMALPSMAPYKAPSLDGFRATFY